ncbi:hypothetical protein WI697_18870 [Tistrella mobilis]|uniref:hypothetical protein n=1 Tax=Tistrella mobilis TaxID=171437 RepID=UPI0031F6F363
MSGEKLVETLADLPPLWATEARETAELVLPLRFRCRWHAMNWFPVEREGDILFGFTTRVIPEWRHFHVGELLGRHQGDPVLIDRAHHPALVPDVPDIRAHRLDDISPFWPSRINLP